MAASTVSSYLIWCSCDTWAFLGGMVLKACGKQTIGAAVSLISAYCIGVPMAAALGLYWKVGIKGLWLGMFCGQAVAFGLQSAYLYCQMDWSKEASKARARARVTQ